MAMNTVIVFPKVDCLVLGFPPMVELTAAEAKAMEMVHLGGIDALCTPTYRTTRRVIDNLVAKGLLAGRGLTELGKAVGKSVAETKLVEVCRD